MQTKVMSTSKLHPPATCRLCGSNARVIKQLTFSYFFCDRCKDECDVWFNSLSSHPKAMKGQYAPQMPNDVIIDKPGIYRIVYLNGDVEWYEHSTGYNASPLRLNGEAISSATRCSDSDLPSRKPVSLAQGTDQGAKGAEPCLGTVPAPEARTTRRSIIDELAIASILEELEKRHIDATRLCGRRYFSPGIVQKVLFMDESNQCVQHRTLPPDDEV